MRYSRHNKILEIISKNEIETQERLCELLKKEGYNVTQATISRDIKELQLIKTLMPSQRYAYALPSIKDGPISNRFVNIFKDTIVSIEAAYNLIVIKTLSGCGPAAGEAIDTLKINEIIGSIAGDNNVLLIVKNQEKVKEVIDSLNEILN